MAAQREATPPPVLVVDLDGTLIHTDLLLEGVVRLLRRNPLYLLLLPLWLLRGKQALKLEVTRRVRIDASLLPYNQPLLAWLRTEQAGGRRLALATASPRSLAEAVNTHLGLFEAVFATDEQTNLAGTAKRDALVKAYGERGFDYAGNARPDLAIWQVAQGAILVDVPSPVARRAATQGRVIRRFEREGSGARAALRSMRIHQWLKNLLIFAPLVAAHRWADAGALAQLARLFLAFSLVASAIYQINDLLDLEADRAHARKRLRPIASGDLSILGAVGLTGALLGAGVWLAWTISPAALVMTLVYVAMTCAYSMALKKRAVMDLVVLASLYTIRIIAGAVAIAVTPSFWLLAFSMFVFLSLATLKRCAELRAMSQDQDGEAPGRGYRVSDLPYLASFGASLGIAAVVILALFINSPEVSRQYGAPQWLWLLCPLLVYWIGRMWIKTGRGEMTDDPIVFAARDPASLLTALIGLCLVAAAT